ncbi:uncharacterized protein LOC126898366 [Daktulosphaira vitifoliae]|uniref:uncharacterized protein LOC126898366 n=1 Tax=Daktulosphaira vitifoliae TaxID=58002 RepID=UPI0021AB003E|nr:uncharacterized protein LOC126898366 [Daktulosphaira vitifoliae]
MRRRKLFEAGKKRIKSSASLKFSGPDRDYGLVEPLDNIPSEEELREKMSNFLVKLNEVDVKKLEFSTRDQRHSQDWYIERKKRLTASNFGDICKMRVNTSCRKKVYSLLYGPRVTSKEMSYGIEMEHQARTLFEQLYEKHVQANGLFVDKEYAFLAVSPDGLIENTAIIEIKCPYVARSTENAVEAVQQKLLPYCVIKNNKIELKKEHKYYYQVMGQMRITGREICYFIIYTPIWINVQVIKYDHEFWITKMEEKLKIFYLECLLPEIVCPLYGKRLELTDIREP